MRMRKKKNGEARLRACAEVLLEKPALPSREPYVLLNKEKSQVFLEIGAGKGGFAEEMARRNPQAVYFAMERVSDCAMFIAERAMSARESGVENLRVIVDSAENLTDYFACTTVDRIFLNFSDPWTKKGYKKRRLTHRRFLALYMNLLVDGGVLTFKTDNTELFDFTLGELDSLGLTPDAVTRDLHASEYNAENVMTEYETAFSDRGMKINMLRVTKPEGYRTDIPDELAYGRVKHFGGSENGN